MKVVVTGGAGFIGSHLCRALAALPTVDDVVAFDDLSTGSRANIEDVRGVRLAEGSVLDGDRLKQALTGAHAVVHLAARSSVSGSIIDPLTTYAVNVTGTLNVLDTARATDAYVLLASSAAVYGDEGAVHAEDGPTAPTSPYGRTKLTAEQYTLSYAAKFGMRSLALRLFNVFGPAQLALDSFGPVLPAFVRAALDGAPLQVHGDGRQSRDFVYVGTVVDVMSRAVSNGITSPIPINVASGVTTTLRALIRELEHELGHHLDVRYGATRSGDVRTSAADLVRFRRTFPDVSPVDLRTGLQITLASIKAQRSAAAAETQEPAWRRVGA